MNTQQFLAVIVLLLLALIFRLLRSLPTLVADEIERRRSRDNGSSPHE